MGVFEVGLGDEEVAPLRGVRLPVNGHVVDPRFSGFLLPQDIIVGRMIIGLDFNDPDNAAVGGVFDDEEVGVVVAVALPADLDVTTVEAHPCEDAACVIGDVGEVAFGFRVEPCLRVEALLPAVIAASETEGAVAVVACFVAAGPDGEARPCHVVAPCHGGGLLCLDLLAHRLNEPGGNSVHESSEYLFAGGVEAVHELFDDALGMLGFVFALGNDTGVQEARFEFEFGHVNWQERLLDANASILRLGCQNLGVFASTVGNCLRPDDRAAEQVFRFIGEHAPEFADLGVVGDVNQ